MDADPVALLRSRGCNVTVQRLAVLRAVSGHPHGSAETIADTVRADLGVVSRQAVYDALGLLTAKGVLRRIQPAGFPALFDSRVGDAHHHAICRACGAIADVEGAPGPRSGSDAAGVHGYVIDEVEIWYRGVCPSCRTAAGTSTTP